MAEIRIVEMGPRDGLQNEAHALEVAERIAMIEALADAGLTAIEAGSFVSPKWVPQMANSNEVLAGLSPRNDVRYPVLVPNLHGLEAALAAGAREVAVFAAASESFSQKNINCSITESLARFAPVMNRAAEAGVAVRGYVSCVLGCPYEGEIDPGAVASVAAQLTEIGCYEISLGDTIGTGTPRKGAALIRRVAQDVPLAQLALHEHNTYGQALANILAALDVGVTVFDASVGGLGGCPYAKGATGNVATEELVYMLEGMGIETGIDLDALCRVALDTCRRLGHDPASGVARVYASRN